MRFIAFNPYGVPVDPTATTACYTNFSDAAACKPTSRAYANPLPGVWELTVESRRTSPFLENPYKLTAAVQGVTVNPATQTVTAPVGTRHAGVVDGEERLRSGHGHGGRGHRSAVRRRATVRPSPTARPRSSR